MIGRASSKRPSGARTACVMGVLAALMAIAAPSALAETPPVKIAHQADRDSGRLVLDFGRPVEYAVERAEPYTFMRFS